MSREPRHLLPEPSGWDWQAEEAYQAELADALNDQIAVGERPADYFGLAVANARAEFGAAAPQRQDTTGEQR